MNPTFNGNDIVALVPGLMVVKTNPYRFPNRDVQTVKMANTDKSVNNGADYTDKKLNITVEIGRSNRALLESSLDTLYKILQGREKQLILPYAGSSRLWYATLNNIADTDVIGGHGTFDIEFMCADPIGRDVNSTTVHSDTLTGSSDTTPYFNVGGSVEWQPLKIQITYSALSGGTNKTVTIGNSDTGQAVTITRTFAAGEVLVIDPDAADPVTINGTPVAFTGAVPMWKPGTGRMDYSDNFTSRTRARVVTQYKRWL